MVQTGAVAWSDGGPGPFNKEELIFPPLQLTRTTAKFLLRGILYNFQFVSPLQEILSKTEQFRVVQWLVVADAASANCKMLPHFFAFLQKESSNSLALYVPCLLHQMARVLVLNLERQGISSYSFWISSVWNSLPWVLGGPSFIVQVPVCFFNFVPSRFQGSAGNAKLDTEVRCIACQGCSSKNLCALQLTTPCFWK